MNALFKRSNKNPILRPNPKNHWESQKLYNPGILLHNGKYHMFYRAMGGGKDWQSSIGYAVSTDGVNFNRFDKPILYGNGGAEKRGLEDPRITRLGDTFYMVYAAYDGATPRLSMAVSKDLIDWQKYGPVLKDWKFEDAGGIYSEWDENGDIIQKSLPYEWSKSGALFPDKINENYWIMFGEYRIWFATSEDGLNFSGDKKPFLEPREGDYFDNTFVEMGPPPIRTKIGWLVFYHGVNDKHWYQIGFLLLDLDNPRKLLYRSEKPIFTPEEAYEISGMVDVLPGGLLSMQNMSELELKSFLNEAEKRGTMPRVVFCCGATIVNDTLRIFYGAGDSVICTATANINKILEITDY